MGEIQKYFRAEKLAKHTKRFAFRCVDFAPGFLFTPDDNNHLRQRRPQEIHDQFDLDTERH